MGICMICMMWTWSVQFDEGRSDFSGDFDEESISNFVKNNQLPLVTEFTQEVKLFILLMYFDLIYVVLSAMR